MVSLSGNTALVLIDVQQAFDDPYWGPGNNPACEGNIAALVSAWEAAGRPIVVVRHDSVEAGSPLQPSASGNALKPVAADAAADLLVSKAVNSAFLGDPDLDVWLRARGISQLVLCGIQTNMCVETTARMGGNLGYDVVLPLDATRTFDLIGPEVGGVAASATADELMRITAINLDGGGFATVTTTETVLAASSAR